jgi:sugar lactone lactonase YvrE
MKNFSITGLIILFILSASGAHTQSLNGPESLTYDSLNSRYLISNVLTGDIVQISDAGDTTIFDSSLSRTLGMTIVDSILYVADISGLVKFDLSTDQKITTIPIAGMIELNDVTADTSGYLYITDIGRGKIIRMRINDHYYTTIVSDIYNPNGILFDARNNRVLFCQFIPNAPIKEINLDDFSVTTVLSTPFANFDGLAIDNDGYIYVSCWGTNAVYRYDNTFNQTAELVSSGHSGPADIFYNQRDNILAVPNYYSNHVDFIPITPANIDETRDQIPRAVTLSQNYPNPFNPTTTIKFQIPDLPAGRQGLNFVTIQVYDVLGNVIAVLVDEEKTAGIYEIEFSATGGSATGGDYYSLTSGIYLYQLKVGNYIQTKKMMLLK